MKNKLIIEIGVIIAIVIFVAVIFWFVRERYWWRIDNVRILSGEKELKGSSVYTHKDGDLLVFLRDGETEKGIYLIKIKSGDIELAGSNQFILVSSSFLLTRYAPPYGVSMNSPKADAPPSLEIQGKEVSFTALSGERVCLYF
ncbi:MAG: hypothetical protein D6687_03140 [Acidobacteria bacterium]|jgi:hypothetical protein|nr:MAG: hypothetical protein D6687_03140 [Acidobacteriota bacterium]GIU83219.1 MAG: hypothetical protein KatS3mg006_2283 [Pyrinomonadaceae bacterium]